MRRLRVIKAIRVSPAISTKLQACARECDLTESAIVRIALNDFFAKREQAIKLGGSSTVPGSVVNSARSEA